MPYTLVMLRHGQSTWNLENLFTGWVDVDLTEQGRAEARQGGEDLRAADLLPHVLHTSRAGARDPHGRARAAKRAAGAGCRYGGRGG